MIFIGFLLDLGFLAHWLVFDSLAILARLHSLRAVIVIVIVVVVVKVIYGLVVDAGFVSWDESVLDTLARRIKQNEGQGIDIRDSEN